MTRPRLRPRTFALFAVYAVLLHALLFVAIWKTNFLLLARKTLGLEPPEERSVDLYQRMLGWARVDAAVPAGSVLVLGDSIMKGLDPAAVAPDAFGFGLGGATIETLVEGLPLLRSLPSARAVVLGVGVNDLKYRAPEDVARDFAALLDSLPPDARVVAVSVLPIDEGAEATQGRSYVTNEAIRRLNEALAAVCAQRAGRSFLDVTADVSDERGMLRKDLHAGDGWHLSAEGSAVLAGAIRTRLDD